MCCFVVVVCQSVSISSSNEYYMCRFPELLSVWTLEACEDAIQEQVVADRHHIGITPAGGACVDRLGDSAYHLQQSQLPSEEAAVHERWHSSGNDHLLHRRGKSACTGGWTGRKWARRLKQHPIGVSGPSFCSWGRHCPVPYTWVPLV